MHPIHVGDGAANTTTRYTRILFAIDYDMRKLFHHDSGVGRDKTVCRHSVNKDWDGCSVSCQAYEQKSGDTHPRANVTTDLSGSQGHTTLGDLIRKNEIQSNEIL